MTILRTLGEEGLVISRSRGRRMTPTPQTLWEEMSTLGTLGGLLGITRIRGRRRPTILESLGKHLVINRIRGSRPRTTLETLGTHPMSTRILGSRRKIILRILGNHMVTNKIHGSSRQTNLDGLGKQRQEPRLMPLGLTRLHVRQGMI
jgi:hypothetical protein